MYTVHTESLYTSTHTRACLFVCIGSLVLCSRARWILGEDGTKGRRMSRKESKEEGEEQAEEKEEEAEEEEVEEEEEEEEGGEGGGRLLYNRFFPTALTHAKYTRLSYSTLHGV